MYVDAYPTDTILITFPVSAYKLKPGSSITLIGSTSSIPSKKETSSVPSGPDVRTESGMNAAIQAELQKVESTITPDLTSLLSALSFSPQKPAPDASSSEAVVAAADSPSPEALKLSHARLGELLLQSLLRLDALTPPTEWEETRRTRKAAVKHVQANLDALDAAWKNAVAAGRLDENSGANEQANGSVKGKGKGKRRR